MGREGRWSEVDDGGVGMGGEEVADILTVEWHHAEMACGCGGGRVFRFSVEGEEVEA